MIIEKKRLGDVLAVKSRRWVWIAYHDEVIDGERDHVGIYNTRREAEDDLLGKSQPGEHAEVYNDINKGGIIP